MIRNMSAAAGALVLSGLALDACHRPQNPDEAAVRAVMMSSWDRPNARLEAGPIAIRGDAAVADWTQGEMGGRALLARRQGGWIVVMCAGDGLRSADGLISAGLDRRTAIALAGNLGRAESAVAPGRLSRMAAFRGVVRMAAAPARRAP